MFTNSNGDSASADQGLMYKLKVSMTNFTSAATSDVTTGTATIATYTSQITDLESKLYEHGRQIFSKFSDMETALSTLSSQSSMISQMFGTSFQQQFMITDT